MGLFDSIFGASSSGPTGDQQRRQWNPLLPRPLYDWEKISADGRVVKADAADGAITKDVAKMAADRAAFLPPPNQGAPEKRKNLFDRILLGINTGQ